MFALLNGRIMDFPKDEWQKKNEQYVAAVKQIENELS
jgi:hypothetical protein